MPSLAATAMEVRPLQPLDRYSHGGLTATAMEAALLQPWRMKPKHVEGTLAECFGTIPYATTVGNGGVIGVRRP